MNGRSAKAKELLRPGVQSTNFQFTLLVQGSRQFTRDRLLHMQQPPLEDYDERKEQRRFNRALRLVREAAMIQTLIQRWWLPGLCGFLYAIISIIYLSQAGHGLHPFTAFAFLGNVTLAAGICTVASGILRWKEIKFWLLVLNGLACGALGLILSFGTSRPIAFRTIALLIVVMAMSIGLYQFAAARTLRRLAGEWFLGAAGAVSIGFALVFLAFILSWIKLEPSSPGQSLHWLGSYFGFSAICFLGFTLHPAKTERCIE